MKEEMYGTIRRRTVIAFLMALPALSVAFSANGKTKSMNPYDERRLLEQNKKIQAANRAPDDFPNFIREGEQWYFSSGATSYGPYTIAYLLSVGHNSKGHPKVYEQRMFEFFLLPVASRFVKSYGSVPLLSELQIQI
jgi:hypothetical protein